MSRVREVVRGTDTADTALRQRATFQMLTQLIREFVGYGGQDPWPPTAKNRIQEYGNETYQPLRGTVNPYAIQPDFEREVLTKLVSAETANAYFETSWFKKIEARAAMQQKAEQERERQAQASIKVKQVLESLAKDRLDAIAKHVDMSVFGIKLGEPLRLPICPASGDSSQTCVLSAAKNASGDNFMMQTVELLQALDQPRKTIAGDVDITSVPVTRVPVMLVAADRPDWFRVWPGNLIVSLVEGYVVAISFGPLGAIFDSRMEETLTEKYGKQPTRISPFTCGSNYEFSTRNWAMTGLHVSYVPATGLLLDCGGSNAIFETMTFRRLREEARAEHRAAQPKL